MSSCPDFLVLTLLILFGSSTTQTKRRFPRSEVDCIDFGNKELKYHLPANIFPWDKLNHLVPCCVENEEALGEGCTECRESVIWKFNSNNHGPTICAKIPISTGNADNLEAFLNTRRLIQAGFSSGIRSRDPNYMSSGQTESPGGKLWGRKSIRYSERDVQGPYEHGNSHGLRSENSPQINQELPPVQNPESNERYPRIFSSEEETIDSGFLERIFSHLFSSDRSIIPLVNTTNENPNQIKQSIIPLDCTNPVKEINPVASDWYSGRDTPDVMIQRRENGKEGANSASPSSEDDNGYQKVPLPNINTQNFANDNEEEKSNGDVKS